MADSSLPLNLVVRRVLIFGTSSEWQTYPRTRFAAASASLGTPAPNVWANAAGRRG